MKMSVALIRIAKELRAVVFVTMLLDAVLSVILMLRVPVLMGNLHIILARTLVNSLGLLALV